MIRHADEGYPFALLGPLGTLVISDRPSFRWRAFSGADSYVVTVSDQDFNEVVTSQPLTTTSLTPPRALERGRAYSWQVTARVGNQEITLPVRPAPEARFRVLEQAKATELMQAEKLVAGSHLTLGILYSQAGATR